MTIDAQQILDAINKLGDTLLRLDSKLDIHIKDNEESGLKVKDMYKLFVTGNGVPSYQERVRSIENWIRIEKFVLAISFTTIATDIVMRVWALVTPQLK